MALVTDPVRVSTHQTNSFVNTAKWADMPTMFFGLIDRGGRAGIRQGRPSVAAAAQAAARSASSTSEGSFPVGLIKPPNSLRSLQLEPGDTLVLFSDGITEAENPERELYGDSRLHELWPAGRTSHSTRSSRLFWIRFRHFSRAPASRTI